MTSLPNSLRDILGKLEFIASIGENQKINLLGYTTTNSNSWFGSIWRRFFGESRKDMVNQINTLIELTLKEMIKYQETPFFPLIIETLSNSRQGILNLITTYKTDGYVVAQLDICLKTIEINLESKDEPLNINNKLRENVKVAQSFGNRKIQNEVNLSAKINKEENGPYYDPDQ